MGRASGMVRGLMQPSRKALAAAALTLIAATSMAAAGKVNVATYHGDTLRTGWNDAEASLTPTVVSGTTFGLLEQVTLDDQVDAQPLLITGITIAGAEHDVAYVATENNSVYAVDASSGSLLLHVNLGTPVPQSQLPGACGNNGPNVGITSTPVIDIASQTIYAIAYVYTGAAEQFVLHALDLSTLADKVAPVVVTASNTLAGGKTVYTFDAHASRQRPALLEAEGNIYAAFGSYCDLSVKASRGWMLGWNAATLAPLGASELTNRVLPSDSPDDYFLTSIWMSGAGPAWGGSGNVFFVTGNSDKSGTTYDNKGAVNLSESVVEIRPALNKIVSYFSPTDSGHDVATLDKTDGDFGAGGVMLLPKQPGAVPLLSVAAGKAGMMYLLNKASLGGEDSNTVLGEYWIGACWCAPSYYRGSDGVGRVVSSGGKSIEVWEVQTSPTTALVPEPGFTPPSISTGQFPGLFTAVSSNGTAANSAVIWAVNRPFDSSKDVTLFAFDAATGTELFSGTAGTWPNTGGDANLVPTVANGKVYVGSYRSLAIFGVQTTDQPLLAKSQFTRPEPPAEAAISAHQVSGFVRAVLGARIVMETRDGKRITVDLSEAIQREAAVHPTVGDTALARGDFVHGMLRAESFLHTIPQPALWRPDR